MCLLKFISKKILELSGWKVTVALPDIDKCIICVAPHTSNWDFILCELAYTSVGRKAGFLMKKDWFFFPLGLFFKAIGGIPVDRSRRTDLVEQLVEKYASTDRMSIAITPEGTRNANANWKTGFYQIALKAKVPIVLAFLDYDVKEIGIEHSITPTGDMEKDIRDIKLYYTQFEPKYKDKFITGFEKK